jgi:hypothetical protein
VRWTLSIPAARGWRAWSTTQAGCTRSERGLPDCERERERLRAVEVFAQLGVKVFSVSQRHPAYRLAMRLRSPRGRWTWRTAHRPALPTGCGVKVFSLQC